MRFELVLSNFSSISCYRCHTGIMLGLGLPLSLRGTKCFGIKKLTQLEFFFLSLQISLGKLVFPSYFPDLLRKSVRGFVKAMFQSLIELY